MPLRRPTPRETLPADILPPDFIARHDLVERLVLFPLRHRTRPRAWAPLTDAEWEALAPMLWALGCGLPAPGARRGGRPMEEAAVRARLDAIFRAVTLKHPKGGRGAWRQLPEEFGRADTVSRTYRRWAQRGLWSRLLEEVADPSAPPVLRRLAYFACCAFRRAWRLIGLEAAVALARRLKLVTALPAPPSWLPDPGLSEIYAPVMDGVRARMLDRPDWMPPRPVWRLFLGMAALIRGRPRLRRAWEPA